jgi:hypothetical protein
MAIIYSYPIAAPKGSDTIVGTQRSLDGLNNNSTVSFTIASVANYVTTNLPLTESFVPYRTSNILANSILSQGVNFNDAGLVIDGNRIKADGTVSVKDSLTINYIDETYPRPFPPYLPGGEFNTEPTGRVGVVNNQDSLEWAFSAVSIDSGQDLIPTNRSGLLHGAQNNYKLSLSNGNGENTVFLNSGGDSFIKGGKLGIGTDTPTEKLDVDGSLKVTQKVITTEVFNPSTSSPLKINRARFYNNGNISNIEGEAINATLHLRTDAPLAAQSVIAITRGGQGTGFPSGITQHTSGDYIFLLRDKDNIARIRFTTDQGDALIDGARIVLCGNSINKNGAITIDGRKWSNGERSAVMKFYKSSTTESGTALEFRVGDNLKGSITYDNSGTSYNVLSDYRLKENVVEITDGIERLKQLKPSRFNFISNTEKVVDGFIAHEVQDVIPEAITGKKDATEEYEVTPAEYDDYGNIVSEAVMGTREAYQQIDQAKIVPLLTAALQEAVAKIESLEARMQTLENN